MQLFNGDWSQPVPQHYCYKMATRTACCPSPVVAKRKMKVACRAVIQPLWSRVAAGATKKWCEPARAASATSFLANCHDLMRSATAPWRSQPAEADGEDSGSEVRADEDPTRSRKKREHKAGRFWGRRCTAPVLLALSICASPVRKFLGRVFGAERNARLFSAGGGVQAKVISQGLGPPDGHTYLRSFVMNGGHVDSTADSLKELLSENSPLMRCSLSSVQRRTPKRQIFSTVDTAVWRCVRLARSKPAYASLCRKKIHSTDWLRLARLIALPMPWRAPELSMQVCHATAKRSS